MIISRRPLNDVSETAREMQRLTCCYWKDLGRWLYVPFFNYFNYICALPYVEDPPEVETVSRPLYTLRENYRPRDCDDKSVLLACWFKGHGLPVRFVGVSTQESRELNHVFIQDGTGMDYDATYPEYHGICGIYPYYSAITYRENLTELF